MKIVFRMIRWKNFLSTGNDFITLRLDENEMTLIIGKNGQGKSQLLDAFCFVLFNKPFRDINKPQLVNSINKKELLVEVAFSIGSDSYVVRRGIKPNIFEIYKNKKLIKQDAVVGDYQTYFEKEIIQTSYKTFTQVNILGKATYVQFMSLKPQTRREVVENILNSQIYSTMLAVAKSELKTISEEWREINTKLQVVQSKIESQNKLIAIRSSDLASQKKTILSDREMCENQIEENSQKILNYNIRREECLVEKRNIIPNVEKVKNTCNQLIQDKGSVRGRILFLEEQLSKLDVDNCPMCLQNIEHSHKTNITERNKKEIHDLEEKLKVIESRQDKITQLIHQYDEVEKRVSEIDNELFSLKNSNSSLAKRSNELLERFKNLENEEEKSVDEEDLSILTKENEELKSKYNHTHKEIDLLKRCMSHLGDDGLKAQLIKQYLPVINQKVNYYLDKLDLFVQFELNEQFEEVIKSRFRDTFSFQSFSEGEKLRIDLALMLTWRYIAKKRNSVATNILIQDEVLDGSFDVDGIRDFMMLLKDLTDVDNIIVISHKSEVIEGFDNIIVAEKVGGFSEYRKYTENSTI